MKYALVTGGSRGIGRAVCIKLSLMGYNVIINYANNITEAQKTLELVEMTGQHGEIMMFDVSDRYQVCSNIEKWQETHPNDYIDVLVNNAGIRRDNILALMPEEDWNIVIDTTLKGFFNTTQTLLPAMIRHKHGRIINMASVSGISGIRGQSNYSTAKGGLIAATKALAQEVAAKNITVNAIAPGFIKTDMTDDLDEESIIKTIPMRRFGTPEEVAELVGFIASPAAGYITGSVISINGGLYT